MASASDTPSRPPRERVALLHAGLVVIASSWLLGGMGPRGEWIVAVLASPAILLLGLEARARFRAGDRDGLWRLARWSAPLVLLAVFVVVSALNPSHRSAFLYNGYVLRPVPHAGWLPASANPLGSLRILACLGGLAATGLVLAFCVHSRRALRTLVLVLAVNALVLAVLGTLQRHSGATGPYFGAVRAANPAWFSTFLYHNHWGAFAVLQCAGALALVFHSLRHAPERGWLHGPGPLLALVALLIAATAPLSSSRSATLLMLALGLAAVALAIRHLRRVARRQHASDAAFWGALGLAAALALVAGLVAFQSRDVIAARTQKTVDQFAAFSAGEVRYTRLDLYADTWRMAADRPAYGWGLESYGSIFLKYSRFRPGRDRLMNTFEDAHSDWLQSLAELGFVGTGLLLALGAVPLVETFRPRRLPAFSGWLLAGCGLIAAYAWVEFPLACPAVVGAWWVFFFAAIRNLQLTPTATPVFAPAPATDAPATRSISSIND